MSVRILLLGPLSDLAGSSQLSAEAPLGWAGLLDTVGPVMAEQLRQSHVHVACAGQVLADKTMLLAQDGDEVALLPPVSGG